MPKKYYRVVQRNQITELEQEINQLLQDGWQTVGGIAIAYKHEHSEHGHVPGHLVYAQSMEKEVSAS